MPDLVSIIIPAFNQLEYCWQCVNSVVAYTRAPYRLILVDNGSTDGVGEFFDGIPGARVIHAGTNKGFAGGVNLGLAQAEGHVVLLNSDTLTPEGWLERLEKALLTADDIGMAGPMSNCVSGAQQIDGLSLSTMDEINAFARDLAVRNADKVQETTRLVGFCLMIRERAWRTVGLFDEGYGIGNFEDDDYGCRVRAAGYRLCIVEDAFVFHYGSRTFLGMGIVGAKWNDLVDANQQRFLAKWQAATPNGPEAVEHARQLNEQARRAVESNDLASAVRLYREAIRNAPSCEVDYNDLGVALWQMGECDHAFKCFVRSLSLNPAYEAARKNLEDAAVALGRTAEVRDLL